MRQLVKTVTIDKIETHPNADLLEIAWIGGWRVIVKKGEFQEKQEAIFIEPDAWVPREVAPFLFKGREYQGIPGEKLRTIKLRGVLSQGLLLPATTNVDGIVKWEPPQANTGPSSPKGNFPAFIPKTDQERIQNITDTFPNLTFEVTEKLEGSSMTVYDRGVCSRNLDLYELEGNAFWDAAKRQALLEKLKGTQLALQGELVGPGIQGNIYNLTQHKFFVFDIFNIETQQYLKPTERRKVIADLELDSVPVLETHMTFAEKHPLEVANRTSMLHNTLAEGVVYKCNEANITFKAINNQYLLKQK